MAQKQFKNWWEEFFNGDFSAVLLDRYNDPEIATTAIFLIDTLNLKPGDLVFDQCCGTGAVSLPIASKGIETIGIDQAEHYIEHARQKALHKKCTNASFEAASAFEYVTPQKCNGAFNWYTSFGYAEDDTINIQMLHRVRESLKPSAIFILDYMNVPNVLANFQPVFKRQQDINGQKVLFEKHTNIDQERGMIGSRWVYKFADGSERQSEGESRLYMPNDLGALFKKAGFEDIKYLGGIHNEPLNKNTQRCFVMGVSP